MGLKIKKYLKPPPRKAHNKSIHFPISPTLIHENIAKAMPGNRKNQPRYQLATLKAMVGWKMILSFSVSAYFQGLCVKLREGNILNLKITAVEKGKTSEPSTAHFWGSKLQFSRVFFVHVFSPVKRVEAHFPSPPQKLEKTTMNEDVSPKKLGDFPAAMLVYWRVFPPWIFEKLLAFLVFLARISKTNKSWHLQQILAFQSLVCPYHN